MAICLSRPFISYPDLPIFRESVKYCLMPLKRPQRPFLTIPTKMKTADLDGGACGSKERMVCFFILPYRHKICILVGTPISRAPTPQAGRLVKGVCPSRRKHSTMLITQYFYWKHFT